MDTEVCVYCGKPVDEDADCMRYHGRNIYYCPECLGVLREAKADADHEARREDPA